MRIRTTGVVFIGECELQFENICTAQVPKPITAVFVSQETKQVNVCRACLEEMVRSGQWEISGARINPKANIVVYDNFRRPQLVLEVKKAPVELGTDLTDWASRVHRNLLAHGAVPFAPFFLLVVTTGQIYLWKHQGIVADVADPDYTGDISRELVKYLDKGTKSESHVVFVNALLNWLGSVKANGADKELPIWLTETGLLNVLRVGHLQCEV